MAFCHMSGRQLPHSDVSMADVQELRNNVQIPGGFTLHQYANLYFDARNPMMYKRKDYADKLCVLSVSIDVLKLSDVVITDQNAASGYVRFYPASFCKHLNFNQIYAESWLHPENQITEWQHKSAKCAEVLVPNVVSVDFILKAYVVNETARNNLMATGFSKPVELLPRLFFR